MLSILAPATEEVEMEEENKHGFCGQLFWMPPGTGSPQMHDMKYPVSPDEREPGAQFRKVPTAESDFTAAVLVGINHIDIAKMPAMVLTTKQLRDRPGL